MNGEFYGFVCVCVCFCVCEWVNITHNEETFEWNLISRIYTNTQKHTHSTGNFEYEDADDVAFVQVALRVQGKKKLTNIRGREKKDIE